MKISYKDVESNCNELHSLAKNMKTISEDIAEIKTNLSSAWKGPAADSYIEMLDVVTSNFSNIYQSIEGGILCMAKCSEGYQAIDAAIMSEICNNLNIDPNTLISPASPKSKPYSQDSEDNYQASTSDENQVEIYEVGNEIIITEGEYKGMFATIEEVNERESTYILNIDVNGANVKTEMDFSKVSSKVEIIDGDYKNMIGKIKSVDEENNILTLIINLNGEDTFIDLDISQVSVIKKEE